MDRLKDLLKSNKTWADKIVASDPTFFKQLSEQQFPKYLWIGCSDSRVPANQIVGLLPGELFVHRNIANVVVHTDLNCLSVVQFAVDVLGVRDIIVCGHYGCSGVRAALMQEEVGIADNWLRHVRDVYEMHNDEFTNLKDDNLRHQKLCELNVKKQVINVCQTSIVRDAWKRGHDLAVHGWIYDLKDGLLNDLSVTKTAKDL